MTDQNLTPSTTSADAGGLGGPDWVTDGARDQKLIAKAIRERWPIKDQWREMLVKGQVTIALDPSQPARDRTRAFTALVAADRANMEAEGVIGHPGNVNVNVGVGVNLSQVAEPGIDDPDYLEWLGRKKLEGRGDAAALGDDGLAGEVHPGGAPAPVEPSSNGNGVGGPGHPASNGHGPAPTREE